jgi:hypothetical protein
MSNYKHIQFATLTLILLGIGIAGVAILFALIPEVRVITGMVLAIMVLVALLFYSLTAEVSADEVVASFGPGVIRRSIRITDIRDARVVRNKWYYGWGVRLVPHGWMFNVSGLDAVELVFESGRIFRIGTNDPEGLLAAIRRNAPHLLDKSG